MTDFSGLWIPLVTPFRDDRVDEVALARLLEHNDRAGCRGVALRGRAQGGLLHPNGDQGSFPTGRETAPACARSSGERLG